MKIIFFGTSQFAIPILEALVNANMTPSLIVTAPDKPRGRGGKIQSPSVKLWADTHRLPVIQPPKLESGIMNNELWNNVDLFVVASYGKIIPKDLLEIPKYGALNVHPSLLPKYRGPSPIQTALLNGDSETGVTIMLMDEEMDHGPTLANYKVQITNSKITYGELERKLSDIGAELITKTIPKWIASKIKPQNQDHAKATYTKKITKEDGSINWHEPAEIIERKIRAYSPNPGVFTFWQKGNAKIRLKILDADVIAKPSEISDGEVFKAKESFGIGTSNGALKINKLQQEGTSEMTAESFLNGHPTIIGAILQ